MTAAEQSGRIRAVLFDVDGTLIDSNDAHARAWADILTAFGYPAELARLRRMIGMGGDKIVAAVTDLDPDGERGKELLAARQARFFSVYFPSVRAFPKSRELFLRLHDARIRTAIATSAKPDELSPLLKRAGVADLVDQQASSGDARGSKPDPDIVHAALEALALPPAQVVMVGDTPFDDEACRRAGVAFVAVRSGGWADADFPSAAAVFDDIAAILDRYPASLTQAPSDGRKLG